MKLDLIANARARLEQIVEERRQSFECVDFAKRRAAALRSTRSAG